MAGRGDGLPHHRQREHVGRGQRRLDARGGEERALGREGVGGHVLQQRDVGRRIGGDSQRVAELDGPDLERDQSPDEQQRGKNATRDRERDAPGQGERGRRRAHRPTLAVIALGSGDAPGVGAINSGSARSAATASRTSAASSQASVAVAAPMAPRLGTSSRITARLIVSDTATWSPSGRSRPSATRVVPSTPAGAITAVARASTTRAGAAPAKRGPNRTTSSGRASRATSPLTATPPAVTQTSARRVTVAVSVASRALERRG